MTNLIAMMAMGGDEYAQAYLDGVIDPVDATPLPRVPSGGQQ